MKPVIAVTTGDPFGIGPEIALKAARRPDVLAACRPLIVGDRARLLALDATLAPAAGGGGERTGAGREERTGAAAGGRAAASWPEVSVSGFAEMGSKQGADFHVEEWREGPALLDMGQVEATGGAAGPGAADPIAAGAPGPTAHGSPGPSAAGGRPAVMYIKPAVG